MSITMNELEAALESILEYESRDNQLGELLKALEHQYALGVQEGMKLAALFSTGSLTGIASPNSFAASRDEAIDADNSDDLYVN